MGRCQHGELVPVPLALVHRSAHGLEPTAREAELGKSDDRFLSDLVQSQAEFDPEPKVARADLVEDGARVGPGGLVGKGPDKGLELSWVANRVAERNPRSTPDGIHDEGISGFGKQEPLVSGLAQPGLRVFGHVAQDGGLGHYFWPRLLGRLPPDRTRQEVDPEKEHERGRREPRSERAGCVRVVRELRPQVIRIRDGLVHEEEECGGCDPDANDRRKPSAIEDAGRQAAGSVEGFPERQEQKCTGPQESRVLKPEIVQERRESPGQQGSDGEPPGRGNPPRETMRHDDKRNACNRRREGSAFKQKHTDEVALRHRFRAHGRQHRDEQEPGP